MTSSWKPLAVIPDGRGNVTLVAYDGTRMGVQRADMDKLIEQLIDERDRYKSLIPMKPLRDRDVEETMPPPMRREETSGDE